LVRLVQPVVRFTLSASHGLFTCHGHPRSLHSFPTRRSSDLPGICPGRRTCRRQKRRGSILLRSALTRQRRSFRVLICPWRRGTRSEEHTSELQSRFDLVCRLLLEKKKKYNTNNNITAMTQTL